MQSRTVQLLNPDGTVDYEVECLGLADAYARVNGERARGGLARIKGIAQMPNASQADAEHEASVNWLDD